MSHRLACDLSDRIVAIAPVAGPIGVDACNPLRPVPVLVFHGTVDKAAPYQGGIGKGIFGKRHLFKSVAETVSGWVGRNSCEDQPKVTLKKGAVTCETWDQCEAGVSVTLCKIEGGGHTWPGGAGGLEWILGPVNRDISSSEMMWKFFKRYSLP